MEIGKDHLSVVTAKRRGRRFELPKEGKGSEGSGDQFPRKRGRRK